ncbi:MAG TPA: DUF4157 domain-containing protein [Kofleriaceae bacterium]|nr:DUF4157 domain-containing protein [Kofleriaceae bacterium]
MTESTRLRRSARSSQASDHQDLHGDADEHALQDQLGNSGVQRLAAAGAQAKLAVGADDDALEREADAVADDVMGGQVAQPARAAEAPAVQRKGGGEAFDAGGDVAARIEGTGGGERLPDGIRSTMEAKTGASFDDVRVHDDPGAHELSASVGAHAFTHGKDIHFARGAYDPGSRAGQHLLAHELTHVVQQAGGQGEGVQRKAISAAPASVQRLVGTPSHVVKLAMRKKKMRGLMIKAPVQAEEEEEEAEEDDTTGTMTKALPKVIQEAKQEEHEEEEEEAEEDDSAGTMTKAPPPKVVEDAKEEDEEQEEAEEDDTCGTMTKAAEQSEEPEEEEEKDETGTLTGEKEKAPSSLFDEDDSAVEEREDELFEQRSDIARTGLDKLMKALHGPYAEHENIDGALSDAVALDEAFREAVEIWDLNGGAIVQRLDQELWAQGSSHDSHQDALRLKQRERALKVTAEVADQVCDAHLQTTIDRLLKVSKVQLGDVKTVNQEIGVRALAVFSDGGLSSEEKNQKSAEILRELDTSDQRVFERDAPTLRKILDGMMDDSRLSGELDTILDMSRLLSMTTRQLKGGADVEAYQNATRVIRMIAGMVDSLQKKLA